MFPGNLGCLIQNGSWTRYNYQKLLAPFLDPSPPLFPSCLSVQFRCPCAVKYWWGRKFDQKHWTVLLRFDQSWINSQLGWIGTRRMILVGSNITVTKNKSLAILEFNNEISWWYFSLDKVMYYEEWLWFYTGPITITRIHKLRIFTVTFF